MAHGRTVGVDIGGWRIKGALVDLASGALERSPDRRPTPAPSTPDRIARVVSEIVSECDYAGPVGVTLPGVLRNGRLERAVNLDPAWATVDPGDLFCDAVGGHPVVLLNDADAAGIAEVHHGAGQDVSGTVLMLTFGTGVGSALLVDGTLVPNMEVGQLPYGGGIWQDMISARARINAGLTWDHWAELTNEFLGIVEDVLWPDLIVIGGGIIEERPDLLGLLSTRARPVVARHGADAGVIGAAMAAGQNVGSPEESRAT